MEWGVTKETPCAIPINVMGRARLLHLVDSLRPLGPNQPEGDFSFFQGSHMEKYYLKVLSLLHRKFIIFMGQLIPSFYFANLRKAYLHFQEPVFMVQQASFSLRSQNSHHYI